MNKDKKKTILWTLLTITTFVTHLPTNGHGNSMIDPAQRSESVKITVGGGIFLSLFPHGHLGLYNKSCYTKLYN